MNKAFVSTPAGQMELFRKASHNAVIEMQRKAVERLEAERFRLVKEWQDGGRTDELWARVEAHDAIIAKQEQILSDLIG
jgi:hypothetical protein